MIKILITGANGFIGSNLTRYLAGLKRYKVFALVRHSSNLKSLAPCKKRITIIKTTGSFENINSALAKSKPDVVVHLAAVTCVEHIPELIEPLINSNILFPALIIEAMLKNNIRFFVNTGTYWEFKEKTSQYHPLNLYAAAKNAFKRILEYYMAERGLRYIDLNLYGTYGANDPRPKFFSLFKKSLTSQKPVLFSPGRQKLDLVYIDDVVDAYEKAIRYVYKKRNKDVESFFIGTGKSVELRKIAKIYEKYACGPLNIKWGAIPYRQKEIMDSQADIHSAKQKLHWQPRFNLKKGIKNMLNIEEPCKTKNKI